MPRDSKTKSDCHTKNNNVTSGLSDFVSDFLWMVQVFHFTEGEDDSTISQLAWWKLIISAVLSAVLMAGAVKAHSTINTVNQYFEEHEEDEKNEGESKDENIVTKLDGAQTAALHVHFVDDALGYSGPISYALNEILAKKIANDAFNSNVPIAVKSVILGTTTLYTFFGAFADYRTTRTSMLKYNKLKNKEKKQTEIEDGNSANSSELSSRAATPAQKLAPAKPNTPLLS